MGPQDGLVGKGTKPDDFSLISDPCGTRELMLTFFLSLSQVHGGAHTPTDTHVQVSKSNKTFKKSIY